MDRPGQREAGEDGREQPDRHPEVRKGAGDRTGCGEPVLSGDGAAGGGRDHVHTQFQHGSGNPGDLRLGGGSG